MPIDNKDVEQLKAIVWPVFAAAFLASGKVHPDDVPSRTDDLMKAYIKRLPSG